MRRRVVSILLVLVCAACAGSDDSGGGTSATTVETTPGSAVDTRPESAGEASGDVADPALRDELLAMMDEDQAEQTGQVATNNYGARTARLAEILDEYGWPTFDLVGAEGSTAAWVIAQHADLDPDVQERALELLRPAAEAGQASRGDLAYLEDRVAAASGADQVYGTQMRCSDDGTPVPATPIEDEASVDERREAAGLPPMADYLAEMAEICAEVAG